MMVTKSVLAISDTICFKMFIYAFFNFRFKHFTYNWWQTNWLVIFGNLFVSNLNIGDIFPFENFYKRYFLVETLTI